MPIDRTIVSPVRLTNGSPTREIRNQNNRKWKKEKKKKNNETENGADGAELLGVGNAKESIFILEREETKSSISTCLESIIVKRKEGPMEHNTSCRLSLFLSK